MSAIVSRQQALKKELMGLYMKTDQTSKGKESRWEKCWAFLNMTFPEYAFRSAATYNYRKMTSAPQDEKSIWAKKGEEFYIRLRTTTELFAKGELNTSY
jgi:hypothetical protein